MKYRIIKEVEAKNIKEALKKERKAEVKHVEQIEPSAVTNQMGF